MTTTGSSTSRVMVFLLIGLVIGGGVGFISTKIMINPTTNELKSEIMNLQQTLLQKNYEYNFELAKLQDNYDELESDYEALQANLAQLSDNYDALSDDFNELSRDHDDLLSDYERILGAVPLTPEPASTEVIEKEYSWRYDGRTWELSLSVPESIYEYYSNLERPPTKDYSIYVTHPYDDEYLRTLIEKINFISISRDYTEMEKVNLVISFVQSLPYTYDSVTTPYDNYPRFPLETLVDGGGDCEDSSILTAALLYGMNYDVILLGLPGHVACGVYVQDVYGYYYTMDDRKYFYLETTSQGWELGDIPDDYRGEGAYLYKLKATPIITHEWTAHRIGDVIELNVTVYNCGTALADNIRVYAAFDEEAGVYVYNREESDEFDLQFGRDLTIKLELNVPRSMYTRLIVGVLNEEGYLIDRSYSGWFNT